MSGLQQPPVEALRGPRRAFTRRLRRWVQRRRRRGRQRSVAATVGEGGVAGGTAASRSDGGSIREPGLLWHFGHPEGWS